MPDAKMDSGDVCSIHFGATWRIVSTHFHSLVVRQNLLLRISIMVFRLVRFILRNFRSLNAKTSVNS